jgi:hypothetical protein
VTTYPNKEHENADKAARRRALNALNDIEREVAILRRRVEGGTADGDDTSPRPAGSGCHPALLRP